MKDSMKNALLLGVIALVATGIAGFTYYKFNETQKARLANQQAEIGSGEESVGGTQVDLGDENDYLDEALADLDALSQ